jgi:ketosteroid isomerase-like protein
MRGTVFGLLLTLATTALAADADPAAERLFAVRFTPGAAWDRNLGAGAQAGMAEHGANLGRLRREGRIQLGARYGDTGLVVLRASDEAGVRALLASDPTLRSGVFDVAIDPFAPFYHGSTRLTAGAETAVLRAFLAAADAADADALAAVCAEDATGTDLATGAVLTGRSALLAAFAARHPAGATRRTELLALEQTGAFLSARERTVVVLPAGPRQERQQLVLYRIADGRVRALWSAPAEPPPVPPAR